MCVCVCVRVCACVCVRVRVCACACACGVRSEERSEECGVWNSPLKFVEVFLNHSVCTHTK